MKYIVYLTANTANNKIYVGVHGTDNPGVFDGYIGCGVYITRPYTYKHSKTAFQQAVNKYGPKVFKRFTLAIFDTPEEAYKMEEEIVTRDFIKRRDVYNMTLGGDRYTDRSKSLQQYTLDGKLIKSWDNTTSAAAYYHCSTTAIYNALTNKTSSCGYIWSRGYADEIDIAEYHVKISEDDTEGPKLDINVDAPIYLYRRTGEFEKEYPSIIACKKDLGVKTQQILTAVRLGRCCHDYQFSLEKVESMKVLEPKNGSRCIDVYDAEGNLVDTLFSHSAVSKKYGVNAIKVLRGQRNQAGNYVFKYRVSDIVHCRN